MAVVTLLGGTVVILFIVRETLDRAKPQSFERCYATERHGRVLSLEKIKRVLSAMLSTRHDGMNPPNLGQAMVPKRY